MRSIALLLLTIFLNSGISNDPINIDYSLVKRNRIYYTKDTNKPYSGEIFSLDNSGRKVWTGYLNAGMLHGQWTKYFPSGKV